MLARTSQISVRSTFEFYEMTSNSLPSLLIHVLYFLFMTFLRHFYFILFTSFYIFFSFLHLPNSFFTISYKLFFFSLFILSLTISPKYSFLSPTFFPSIFLPNPHFHRIYVFCHFSPKLSFLSSLLFLQRYLLDSSFYLLLFL